jgi:phosphoglycolate phosphatase
MAETGRMRTVIFDLDGTLADTAADLVAAANACFRARGAGDLLDPVADAETAFRGGRAMLRLGYARLGDAADEALIDADYPRLLAHYGAAIADHTRLYPGAEAALDALAAAGFALGICTNKPEALAEALLARLGIRQRFASLIGADTLAVRKPDPEALRRAAYLAGGPGARALLVGDTATDRDTARAAGVPLILVGFGPLGPGIAALGPDAVLDHFDELADLAARLLGPGLPGPRGGAMDAEGSGEPGQPGAEGATAPETLRPRDRSGTNTLERGAMASADGITISGERTEGARNGRPTRPEEAP